MKLITKLKVASLCGVNFIVVLVNTILFPVFPQIKQALNIGIREISFLPLVVSLTAAFLCPIGGVLADKWGRKRIIIYSLLLYGIGGVISGIFALANQLTGILVGRVLQGIGTASPMFLTIALAGDIFQSEQRVQVIGYLETANGLGKLFSPIIGGFIGLLGWYAPFFFYIVVALPVAAAIWFLIKEPPRQKSEVSLADELKQLSELKKPACIFSLVAAFLVIFIIIGTMFWLGNIPEERIGNGKVLRGLIISLPVAAMMVTTLFSKKINTLLGIRVMMASGLIITAISLSGIPFFYNTFALWFFLLLTGIGAGFSLPAIDSFSAAVTPKENRGIFTTVYGSIRSFGAAVAPLIFALFLRINLHYTFLPIAAVSLIVSIILLLTLKPENGLPAKLQDK